VRNRLGTEGGVNKMNRVSRLVPETTIKLPPPKFPKVDGKGAKQMKVIIEGEPNEIAALVVAVQERQEGTLADSVADKFTEIITEHLSSFRIP